MLSNGSASISFENIGKKYQIGGWRPSRFMQSLRRSASTDGISGDFWALRDVSFQVRPGEVLGIIGNNGAGKSTILKILAGVTKPTTGSVRLRGRLSALIELGAGFHPELSGRDNIYLNGAILGLAKRKIDQVFADIVDFAELEEFIDTPVKHYSSGMYARLGFSIAIHVDPDILVVDEVLSVGDYAFQQKSLERMLSFRQRAKAMVFVSHNLAAVQMICDRVIWLQAGEIRMIGKPSEVIPAYQFQKRRVSLAASAPDNATSQDGVFVKSVTLQDHLGASVGTIKPNEPLLILIDLQSNIDNTDITIAIAIYQQNGMKCGETNSTLSDVPIIVGRGCTRVAVKVPSVPLVPGDYYLNVAVSQRYLIQFDHISYAASFEIASLPEHVIVQGPVYFESQWAVAAASDHETDHR